MPPAVQTLRLGGLEGCGEGWIRKRWTPSPELLNVDGTMFGGYLTALADQAVAFAIMTAVQDSQVFRTINLSMNFVRLGRPETLLFEGRVIAQMLQMITSRVELYREDCKFIAEALAQELLIPLKT